jgi:micrococcal nuclease
MFATFVSNDARTHNARMNSRMLYASSFVIALLALLFGAQGVFTTAKPLQTAAIAQTNTANLYPVVKVVDGDTVDILKDGAKVRLRLIGLDTPEIVDPRKPVQCFAREASAKAKEFLANGTNFNKLMIAEGYGHEYTYDLPYKYQKDFRDAEKVAREKELGLWSPQTCAGDTRKSANTIP